MRDDGDGRDGAGKRSFLFKGSCADYACQSSTVISGHVAAKIYAMIPSIWSATWSQFLTNPPSWSTLAFATISFKDNDP